MIKHIFNYGKDKANNLVDGVISTTQDTVKTEIKTFTFMGKVLLFSIIALISVLTLGILYLIIK